MAEKDVSSRGSNGLTVKVNVDVSEALTGLKAIQREAKKATAALRELTAARTAVVERTTRADAARE